MKKSKKDLKMFNRRERKEADKRDWHSIDKKTLKGTSSRVFSERFWCWTCLRSFWKVQMKKEILGLSLTTLSEKRKWNERKNPRPLILLFIYSFLFLLSAIFLSFLLLFDQSCHEHSFLKFYLRAEIFQR
jgi:hypothetical protein